MEAFQLLSRGGAQFDKKRFKGDVELFQVCICRSLGTLTKVTSLQPSRAGHSEEKKKTQSISHLPSDLDFFKYAESSSSKRKTDGTDPNTRKKRRVQADAAEDDGSDDEEEAPRQKHRVTAKGIDIPAAAQTFAEMKERYDMPSLLLSNLSKHGFKHPTGIQSHGIPILLEVRAPRPSLFPPRLMRNTEARPRRHIPHWYRKDALLPPPHNGSAGISCNLKRVRGKGRPCSHRRADARTSAPNTQRVSEARGGSQMAHHPIQQSYCKYALRQGRARQSR